MQVVTLLDSKLDMPTLWLLCQLSEDFNDFIFKEDGVLPYFHMSVQKPECTPTL